MAAGAGDTAALVVALSAQLSKFERDMRQAVDMADKATGDIENKFSSMNPQVSASFFGNLFSTLSTRAIDAVKDAVSDLIKRMEDLQATAKYTETSLNFLFGLQEASKAGGAAIEDTNRAIRGIAESLDQMKRGGGGPLADLLNANPQLLRGLNRETLTLAQTLDLVAQGMRDAKTEISAVKIGAQLGVPANVVQSWEQYGRFLSDAIKKASASGPDLDDLAAKTKVLNAAWKKFTDELGVASINLATAAIEKMRGATASLADVQKATAAWLAERAKGTVFEPIVEEMVQGSKDYEAAVKKALDDQQTFNERWNARVSGLQDRLLVTPDKRPGAGTTIVPQTKTIDEASHAFDRQIESVEKHTAKLQADAATVGESESAQEEYRIQIQLTEAALTQYGDVTGEVQDKIAALAARAAQAKQTFAEQTAALQKLNSASQQIGSALSTAFADAIVEGKSFNEVLSSMIKTLEKAAINSVIGNLFAPAPGQTSSLLAQLFGFGGAKQSGGPIMAGRSYLVGEHGPEMIVPNQAGMVVPNDALRGGMGAGGAIVYSPAIDARGASVEAVARLAQIMEQDRAAFATRTVAVIQQARRGRVRGL